MIRYKFGDVVLVSFSQSNGVIKQRPALAILDIGDDDVVLASITSVPRSGQGDYKIEKWKESGLLFDSWVRLAKVAYLEKNEIITRIGVLSLEDRENTAQKWRELYKL